MNTSDRLRNILQRIREPELSRGLLEGIKAINIRATLMEVCGTHTMALFTSGIRSGLNGSVRFVSGPGCPVCVTPVEVIEKAIGLARRKGTALFCFGDMMRVPGSTGSLASARASRGARVRIMYSPMDALEFARENQDTNVVMLGIGFETTVPLFAAVLIRARREKIKNLRLLPSFRLIPPALEFLLRDRDISFEGLILPGHVSAIIGERAFGFIAERYGIPAVIAGFEAADMLQAILMLLRIIRCKRPSVKNEYTRCVAAEGNRTARRLMEAVFEPAASRWRGLGIIPASGLRLRDEFSHYDAEALVDFEIPEAGETGGCICGEIITGRRSPPQCPHYKGGCTPSQPLGPCMVSSEGTCAAYFKYGGE